MILSDFIQKWLTANFDIIFFTETHLVKGESFKMSNFIDYHNLYSTHADRKPRGRVSCFIKNTLLPFVSEIHKNIPGHIVVRFLNGQVIFSSYIAPADSPYCDPSEFSHVANAFTPLDNECLVFGGGDLNGRVGDLQISSPPNNGRYRSNCDQIVNGHGKEIVGICRSFSCYIVNNLAIGEQKVIESHRMI